MKCIKSFSIILVLTCVLLPSFAYAVEPVENEGSLEGVHVAGIDDAPAQEMGEVAYVEAEQPAATETDATAEETLVDSSEDGVSEVEVAEPSEGTETVGIAKKPELESPSSPETSVVDVSNVSETIEPEIRESKVAAPNSSELIVATVSTKAPAQTVVTTKPSTSTDSAAILGNNKVFCISTALAAKDTKVLDVAKGSTKSGANIQIYEANNTLAQFWRAEYKGNGIYNLVSYSGDHILGVSGKLASRANVINTDTHNINWRISKNSDNTYSLIPASASNLRLDVASANTKNATNVWLYTSNGTKAQKFYFTEYPGMTEAYLQGKNVNPGVVEIALASNENLRVDIQGVSTASGANVQLANDTKAMSQKYQLRYIGNGLYEFQDAHSGKVLDVASGSKKAGANVWQYTRNQTIAQYWYFAESGNGYQIKSAVNALAFDTKDYTAKATANVQMEKPSSAKTQLYTLKSTALVDNGTYVIQSALIMPMVLDVSNGSKASKANLQLYRSNGTDAQKFTITYLGNGMYSIVGFGSGNYVDVSGASKASGANVWMYEWNGTDAQKWRIEIGPNGLMFKSVSSGKYLDVANGKSNKGTNIQQYTGNETLAQCWVLHDENWMFYPNSTNLNDMKIITKAEEYDGWRYRWGGRSPATSFDCAGLVMYCSNKVWGTNFDLMMTNADKLYSMCTPITASQAKVGDLVFYRGTYNNINYISHVVIYAGNGIMYGAGDPIGYSKVDSIKNMRGAKATYMFARIKRQL